MTTLARAYRLTRPDGLVLGFTDHDEDVAFDGTAYLARAALTASEASASLGLGPDELDATGALAADAITEADLAAGRYDGATVEAWEVDWTDPARRRLLGRYTIGRVERAASAFRAELRSLAAGLGRSIGRVHATLCDAALGDGRCGVILPPPSPATVAGSDGGEIILSGASIPTPGHYDRGRLSFVSGILAGTAADIRLTRDDPSGGLRVSLWAAPHVPPAVGDEVRLAPGCDKTAATCAARFGNLVRFRGFPHMPGPTFAQDYARPGDPNLDGGSRFE